MLLIASMALAEPAPVPFPERSPVLIAECLANAVETGAVSDTEDSYKYMCTGDAADRLWTFLEKAKVESYEQDVGEEGVWLSREFPLGGCFKRLRPGAASRAAKGLSCSIWIPRPAS